MATRSNPMPPTPPEAVSHQNVRLMRGRHNSPERGACVVELASMLAHEPFSDHPRSVCPVIAAYMRALNDAMEDAERDRLYPYAAAIVDSRGSRKVRKARARACAAWCRELGAISRLHAWSVRVWGSAHDLPVTCARRALRSEEGAELAIAIADRLIAIDGSGDPAAPMQDPQAELTEAHSA